jgi:hypothetical protein
MSELISQKLEKILTDWMKTLSFSYPISFYSGIDIGEPGNEPIMDIPRCVIACSTASERIKDTGIYDLSLEVMIAHSADDSPRLEHTTMSEDIAATLTNQTNLNSFNNTVDFYIYDTFPQSSSFSAEDRKWVTTVSIQAVGMAQNGYAAP